MRDRPTTPVVWGLSLAMVAASGCATIDVPEGMLAYGELEAVKRIGRAGAATMLQGNVVLISPDVRREVQRLADELIAAAESRTEIRIHIINSSLVNLLALPSGDVIVFTGFLDTIDNRDELAFGLGHEIAHVLQGHGLKQLKEGLRLQREGSFAATVIGTLVAAAASGAVGGALSTVSIGVLQPLFDKGVIEPVCRIVAAVAAKIPEPLVAYILTATSHAYSREQEMEADKLGMQFATKAGYDARAAISVMNKLAKARQPR